MVVERWIIDTEPSRTLPVYTRANAGEVLPDPASPLGWTLVWRDGVVMGWYDCQLAVGTNQPGELHADRPEVVGVFGGYLYINASLARLFGVRAPGLSPELVDRTFFGDHPDVPAYVPEAWHENEVSTARMSEWMTRVLATTDRPELMTDRRVAEGARADRPELEALTDQELVARARSFTPAIRLMFEHHLEMTAGASIGPGVLAAIGASLGDATLALRLITGLGDVDSALPSHALWALSRRSADDPGFEAAFAAFLVEHGCRGPNEWDIRSDTWETKPALAMSLIEVMRKAGDDADPVRRAAAGVATREAAAAHVRAALADQPDALAQFEAALVSAHVHLAGRERAKTTIVKVVHEVRMAVRELGDRAGYPLSAICMMLEEELDAFVTEPDEFRVRIAWREQQYRELFDLAPPFIVDAAVPALGSWARRASAAVPAAGAGTVLTGVAGCPGRATGRARVITDPADPGALEPGDVLIAPLTDPAWTPLFVPAAAVVVEVGAQVSHAVIVCRELGIPCVVSVHGATQRIPDGALVDVDGDAATVTVVALRSG